MDFSFLTTLKPSASVANYELQENPHRLAYEKECNLDIRQLHQASNMCITVNRAFKTFDCKMLFLYIPFPSYDMTLCFTVHSQSKFY